MCVYDLLLLLIHLNLYTTHIKAEGYILDLFIDEEENDSQQACFANKSWCNSKD
jgi:hypothetical protein